MDYRNRFFFKRYTLLNSLIIEFVEKEFKQNNTSHTVAEKLWTVYNKCDEIDYKEYELAVAYSIIHFSDRYNRFIKSFLKLIDHGYLPLNFYKEIEILDVGTGPGPTLFAISDIYNSILEFAKATNNPQLQRMKFNIDYVERSTGFRHWLHHFTEFVNYKTPDSIFWNVPYHHGTYEDFTNIEFNIKTDYFDKTLVLKKRFNLVIFSNFLTQEYQVDFWENQIRNCFRFIRNNGKLIAIGARGGKYEQIYKKLDSKLLDYDFSNSNNIGKCKKLIVNQNHLVFDLSDRFGLELKNYFRRIFYLFESNDSVQYFSEEVKNHFNNYMSEKTGKPKKWNMQVYQKYARIKRLRIKEKIA